MNRIPTLIPGLHHVTALAGDPRANVDFYTRVLGLRLVKQTVNFDDPHTYHLYYGDDSGRPGSLMTFFPWGHEGWRGRRGLGQASSVAFSVPEFALGYWSDRLKQMTEEVRGPYRRFDDEVLMLRDHDGFEIEIVASAAEQRAGWPSTDVPENLVLRGFHSVTLPEASIAPTERLLTTIMELRRTGSEENRHRFTAGGGEPGTIVDLVYHPDERAGTMGVGALHHVAWRTPSDESQVLIQGSLLTAGYNVTPIVDRSYFRSVYFHEPGGVLFEIATDPPGFLIDETYENLGSTLKLPPWLEQHRMKIKQHLFPLTQKSVSVGSELARQQTTRSDEEERNDERIYGHN